ncbi:MAG: hypothetical protein EB119_08945, partial [Synechococcaceae bacterium WBB_34_004]|nr:hypothetical protein [Synechococcaceae bacterium WBB_34_004]
MDKINILDCSVEGSGSGDGSGHGDGFGDDFGDGDGYGSGNGYGDGDGSTLSVSTTYAGTTNTASTTISAWKPELGAVSANLVGVRGVSDWSRVTWTWNALTAPSFAPRELWVNGWLVSWQLGTLSSSGSVEDRYVGASGQLEVRISGGVASFSNGQQTAEVRIQGG